jgi:predicted transcriptional regulator
MDLIQIVQKGQKLVNDLKHGGANPEYIEMEALNALCDEILQELGEIERYDEIKRVMVNMFFFGQVISK